jgi:hypothetical protein
MSDRYDFEQQITKCWFVVDDLKELDEGLFEGWLKFDKDNVSNHILAIANSYDIKFSKLWELFESVYMDTVRENKMLNEECAALREQLIAAEGCGSNYKSGDAGRPTLFGKLDPQGNEGIATITSNKKVKK